jgi:serine protease Do
MNANGFGEVAEKLRRSTVQVVSGSRRERGFGSGVISTSDGQVITNAHVVRDKNVQVELWDGRSLPAQVASLDDRADLARLKLNTAGLAALAWRRSPLVRPGELVIAVGNPLGFVGALSTGVVHLAGPVPGLGRRPWIQAAIRLAPGNSGGPLADAEGRVVGINTMMIGQGLALAIPSSSVEDFLKRGSRPSLGVVVQTGAGTAGRTGLLVLQVTPQGRAENASLLKGDLLIAGNGHSFTSAEDLGDVLDQSAGTVLKLRFLRGDRRTEREVAIALPESRPEAA